MPKSHSLRQSIGVLVTLLAILLTTATGQAGTTTDSHPDEVALLVAAMLGDTPLMDDLRHLTDEIGGRPTGSAANRRAVEWALDRFREAGVSARQEAFAMPAFWRELSASILIEANGISFSPRVAANPFSAPADGLRAPLISVGRGTEEDFSALGERAAGAFLLVETQLLEDIKGLFEEYINASKTEERAFAAGARGIIYMGSRSSSVLYRHLASLGPDNQHPLMVMERDGALRAQRLLAAGHQLSAHVTIAVEQGPAYESHNVIAEIPGTQKPEQIVIIGAHLDSWELGTGALDNACNVALIIDVARQMARLGLQPRRTIRFALYNGEEQGLHGSWGYTLTHEEELDRHVVAASFDLGAGRIVGFLTGGRPEIAAAVAETLQPVAGLGPFRQTDIPMAGTDHFDFFLQGVANLVADQDPAGYAANYHARTDTFDKVDPVDLHINAAVAAAVTYGFANMDVTWGRLTRDEITHLIETTDLGETMRAFHLMEAWEKGTRGRSE